MDDITDTQCIHDNMHSNRFIQKQKYINELEKDLKSMLLRAVKMTADADANSIASYKVSDDFKEVKIEYVLIACDSHTCVDYSKDITLPIEWLEDGFDIQYAWRQKQIDDKQKEIECLMKKASILKEKADDILAEYEDISMKMQQLSKELNTINTVNTAG